MSEQGRISEERGGHQEDDARREAETLRGITHCKTEREGEELMDGEPRLPNWNMGSCSCISESVCFYLPTIISIDETFLVSLPSPTTSVPMRMSFTENAPLPNLFVTISATSTALLIAIPLAFTTISPACVSWIRADIA